MNSRLLSIIRKEFIQIWRDPRTLTIVLIIPILQLFLLGYSATNDVRNVPLAVYDQSYSSESRALLDDYRTADYFKVAFAVNSEAELRQIIESGQAKAGLIIPPDYAQRLKEGTAQVAFVLDGSDPTVASTSLSAAQLIGQKHATDILSEKLVRSGQGITIRLPVEVRTTVWYNPDLASAYFMIPGVIGMVLFALTAMLTATAVVRERERGTIEQLIVTPIRSWELILGKLIPYTILSFFNMLEVLAGIAIGVWGIRATIKLVKGTPDSYLTTIKALVAGVAVGGFHIYASRMLRGKSMLVDAVVYTTILTLAVFLIFRIPGIWQGVNFDKGSNNGNTGGWAAAITLVLVGISILSLPFMMAETHTFVAGGINWAATWSPPLNLIGSLLIVDGLGWLALFLRPNRRPALELLTA
jgi:ABC-type Na+ efflux pump permease subunit